MSLKTIAEASFRALDLAAAHDLPALDSFLYGAILYPDAALLHHLQKSQSLQIHHLDWSQAEKLPGVVKCVQSHHFLGVIATQMSIARQARNLIKVQWAEPPHSALNLDTGETYSWDPTIDNKTAWAAAQYTDEHLRIWLSTAHPRQLHEELTVLTGLEPQKINLYQATTSATEAYDIAIEAALLAMQVQRPVYVEAEQNLKIIRLSFEKGNKCLTSLASNTLPNPGTSMAASLLGWRSKRLSGIHINTDYAPAIIPQSVEWIAPTGQQTDYASALTFALESAYDETQRTNRQDPIQARLAQMTDERGKQVIQRAARQAGWINQAGEPYTPKKANRGYGLAYIKALDHEQIPAQEVWSAWAVELDYDSENQQFYLGKVTVAFDTDRYDEPIDSKQTKIKRRVAQWTQNLLGTTNTRQKEGKTEPDQQQKELAHINIINQSPVVNKPLAWSQAAELPAAAAIANAVRDATNIRLHHVPLDLALAAQRLESKKNRAAKKKIGWAGGLLSAFAGALLVANPWRISIPPVATVDTSIFSEQAINRGRLVAMAGDCMVCHTADGGQTNAGGLAIETPFGKVYSTNITPDNETGIGNWSYKAFERAMRDGIHRDGSHLYPAFPYTSYAQLSDEDLQSLYAYLMVQEPVHALNKKNELSFPFNFRPLLAGWNMLFHKNRQAYEYDEDQSQLWNRGAYLVNSSGHCAACHSPRNALGGEKKGLYFLAGGEVDGWEAPALNALANAPLSWKEDELFQYLRTGHSTKHGMAAGPMGPVIAGLAELPEYDVRAMAHYLLNLQGAPENYKEHVGHQTKLATLSDQQAQKAETDAWLMPGRKIYEGACAACHDEQAGPALFGARPSLASSTNLHNDRPDNLIQIILHGITRPSSPGLGNMPAFKHSLNDDQVVNLLQYLRKKYASDTHEWPNLRDKIQEIRRQSGHP